MKNDQHIKHFLDYYPSIKNQNLSDRYLNYKMLASELEALPGIFEIREEGSSTLGIPINSITFGNGDMKILGWSQMHGNESTTTRSLFDLLNYLHLNKEDSPGISEIFRECTVKIIPMLNPDGASAYTRENAQGIDLNRDADLLSQRESKVLRSVLDGFKPHFCLNLHDQRTIFSAGAAKKPATLSFLAPSFDEDRSISLPRKKAMQVIAGINDELQEYLPGQIGRFDDGFNINCTGDRFMAFDIPTILFEAGHFQGDYMREETRKYMAAAILASIKSIMRGGYEDYHEEDYELIPENQKKYFDIILRNVGLEGEKMDIALQYQEKLSEEKIVFEPRVQLIDKNLNSFAHREIDCKGEKITHRGEERLFENDVVEGILLNTDYISFKIE